jgi:cytochrome b6-f complex iron-sulfur subunit
VERKDFIRKTFALCSLALVPAGLAESCSKQSYSGPTNVNFTLDLSNSANAALNAAGGAVIANGVIVVHTGGGVYEALSATCTHAGCTVGYNAGSAMIVCPCHGGTFNVATGAVIGGPPPSALSKYTVTQTGTILTIKS